MTIVNGERFSPEGSRANRTFAANAIIVVRSCNVATDGKQEAIFDTGRRTPKAYSTLNHPAAVVPWKDATITVPKRKFMRRGKKIRTKSRFVIPERTCFVMMPFGSESNDRYETLYVPAIRDAGMSPHRADSLSRPSPIMEDIWHGIKEATVLLADLTDCNANVFYELGLAHGICKPAVLVTDRIDGVPFDLRALRLLVYKRGGANPSFRKKLARALCQTEEHSKSALPAAIAALPRAFERSHALGGRSVRVREFDRVANSLKNVPASTINAALKRALGQLSGTAQRGLSGEMFWEESRKKFASPKVLADLRSRMASMGRNFPDCLLAEVIYALDSGSEHITIHVLVETGFARDMVEANVIFDVVEWAMGQAGL